MSLRSEMKDLAFNFFIPAKITSVEPGVGSFLNFFLVGQLPTPEGSGVATSKIQIWIYLCDWIIYEGDREVLNSEIVGSSKQSFSLSSFNGASMTGIRFDEDSSCVIFDFDHGLRLKLSPNVNAYGADEDLFLVYLDDKILFSFSWERKFYWDTPSKEH
jgi:hypothetical protein